MDDSPLSELLQGLLQVVSPSQVEVRPDKERLLALEKIYKLCRGEEVSLPLLTCMESCIRQDASPAVVLKCVEVLSLLKPYSAATLLIDVALGHGVLVFKGVSGKALMHGEQGLRLRCKAIRGLGLLGDERALIPLMGLLNDKDLNYRVRLEAAESLGRLGDSKAVAPLLEVMSDDKEPSLYLKESAIKALGMLGDMRALDPLLQVWETKQGFKEKFQFVAEQLIMAVGRLAGKDNAKANEALLRALQDVQPEVRLAAAESAGELANEAYLPALQLRLWDESTAVAQCALAAIYKIGNTPALRELLTLENLPSYLREEILDFLLESEPDEAANAKNATQGSGSTDASTQSGEDAGEEAS
jgi:HEAT repeat protein